MTIINLYCCKRGHLIRNPNVVSIFIKMTPLVETVILDITFDHISNILLSKGIAQITEIKYNS